MFVPPWVYESLDSRPRKQRSIGGRVGEAETGRGFVAASATRRLKAEVTPRPRLTLVIEPRAAAMLADQPAVGARRIACALGYVVKPFQGMEIC